VRGGDKRSSYKTCRGSLKKRKPRSKKVSNEAAIIQQAAPGVDPESQELERQLQELQPSGGDDVQEEALMKMLTTQVDEVKRELDRDNESVMELEARHQELEECLADANKAKSKLEVEVQRERQLRETEAELAGQAPEDQKLILEAHEQKLRSRAEALKDQIAQIQTEGEERKANVTKKVKEQKELQTKSQEAGLQIEVVMEERDAMREAMEQLWNEYAMLDEELTGQMQAYINLSERLETQQDEFSDLEMSVEQKRNQVDLQKNGFH